MFVVAGITGQTGSAAALALLAGGRKVRALVREPARAAAWSARGVDLVQGDVTDKASLARAFAGAEGAYMLIPPRPDHPEPLAYFEHSAHAIREAALAAGLGRLVFLSSEGAHLPEGTGPIRGLHRAEAILAGAASRLTLIRPSYFQENWRSVFGLAAAQGIMPTMFTDLEARRGMVATADIGRVAAELLGEIDAPEMVELSGPQDYSAADAAAAMAAALGRPVVPVQPPREAWADILMQNGLSEAYAALIAEMYDGINSGFVGFSGVVPLRRGEVTLRETIASWTPAAAA